MNFEISGKIIEIYDEVQISDRFKKREFVIEKNESGFTDQVKFQLVQDKTPLITNFSKGDEVSVSFNIRGNKWKDTYFVNLQAWRIQPAGQGGNMPPHHQSTAPPPPAEQDDPGPGEEPPPAGEDDDLPF